MNAQNLWPLVTETKPNGMQKTYDIPSRLLMDRIVMLTEEVNNSTAASIIGQLLFLESINPNEPITMYINSPGGTIVDGLAIYDIMNSIKCPVDTICVGLAASMAAVLLCAGTGKRYATASSTVMIHQPLGGCQGQATEMVIRTNQILKHKEKLCKIIAEKTGQDYQKVYQDCERDYFMDAEQALAYGMIDEIKK